MDIRTFFIKPMIPERLKPLHDLAFNIWTCWDKDAAQLFHRLDPALFRRVNHNPVELLCRLSPERLKEIADDKGFLYELDRVSERFQSYMNFEGSSITEEGDTSFSQDEVVAYICAEYGLHESLPVYSGGLAVLAGDQLKAASDVGCSMVSFGLLYRYGYFNQHITSEGAQIEEYRENTWYMSAVQEVTDANGQPLVIEVPLKNERVMVKIWRIQVGRVPLYLMDTNIHQNKPEHREITSTLYAPGRRPRLEQELLLGRGSVIALRALGIKPRIYHLNEGHTAFSILERLLELMQSQKHSLDEARSIIRYSTVFTTHTPVAAGNEHFTEELITEYLSNDIKALGISMDEFLSWGHLKESKPAPKPRPKGETKPEEREEFWLPAMALRFARRSNGVSDIHAEVSRSMWRDLYPMLHERELPIEGVTNGVHLQSWLSLQMTELFNRYIGPDYLHRSDDDEIWKKVRTIPDGEIWNAHRRRKEQVVSFIRRRIGETMRVRGYCTPKVKDVDSVLNPDSLTIGFARRFAEYKRADLLLRDPDRLAAILLNEEKPVQLVFAGKAHPADGIGKELIARIVEFINRYPVENNVVFLEDYDINIARHIVQGVDVWLNTPRRPMEASGTSGMKAGINGVLNLSVLDGWWPEAYDEKNGWAIDAGVAGAQQEIIDELEAMRLYELLEHDISDLYYRRTESDLPQDWVEMMKHSIETVCCGFNMHRTVREYITRFYLPERQMQERILDDNGALLRQMAEHRKTIDAVWPKLAVRDFFTNVSGRMPVSGEQMQIECYIYLDDTDEKLFAAEAFYVHDDGKRRVSTVDLPFVERYPDGVAKFVGSFPLTGTGLQEVSARLVPADPDFREIYPQYVKWKD